MDGWMSDKRDYGDHGDWCGYVKTKNHDDDKNTMIHSALSRGWLGCSDQERVVRAITNNHQNHDGLHPIIHTHVHEIS